MSQRKVFDILALYLRAIFFYIWDVFKMINNPKLQGAVKPAAMYRQYVNALTVIMQIFPAKLRHKLSASQVFRCWVFFFPSPVIKDNLKVKNKPNCSRLLEWGVDPNGTWLCTGLFKESTSRADRSFETSSLFLKTNSSLVCFLITFTFTFSGRTEALSAFRTASSTLMLKRHACELPLQVTGHSSDVYSSISLRIVILCLSFSRPEISSGK